MTPYEIMLSESQERMLLVAERGREGKIFQVFGKWGLDAVEIGAVTADGLLRVREHGRVVAEIRAHPLAEEGPFYERPTASPALRPAERLVEFAPDGADLTENLRRLLASPAIASKRWIFEQYDHMVRTNTLEGPGAADAAVLRVKGTKRALALSVDSNGRWCWLEPRAGAMAAVAEAARNVACTGARPIAATNCLNFGNPEKPEVMWQFSRAVDGIAEACRALATPITGGNVSFYNETLGKSIYPTPVIGVLGLLEDASHALGTAFRQEGDAIVLLDGWAQPSASEDLRREFSSSEYAKTIHGLVAGAPPKVGLAAEKQLIDCLVALASEGLLVSAHDVSDGGLAVALTECCFAADALSAEVSLEGNEPAEAALFGERGVRAVVSGPQTALARVLEIARQYGVAAQEIGQVTRGNFCIQHNARPVASAATASLRDLWANALERALRGK